MPTLDDPQREEFAQALARGCKPREASRQAGYEDEAGVPYARAREREIVQRKAELIRDAPDGPRCLNTMVNDLMNIADTCRHEVSIPGVNTAVRAIGLAAELLVKLDSSTPAREEPKWVRPEPLMENDAWEARFRPLAG
jgi:hypothetical protein